MVDYKTLGLVNTKELFRQGLLVDAEMIIKSSLGAPTDVERRVDIGLAPLHDLTQLIPIINLLERKLFHRCACNYHAVKFAVLQLIKALVKREQVLL